MTKPDRSVLLVEDEPLVQIHSRLALEDAGYEVHVAGDVAQAMAVLATTHVDAVFTDVRLPGEGTGADLARHVEHAQPGTRIVVTSGAAEPAALPESGSFLPKPYTAAQVTRLLD